MIAVRLFLLPFAGGASYAYRGLVSHLPPGIEPLALDLPGHGRRLREPLLHDLEAMARDLWREIRSRGSEGPYAILGHSLGALLAYRLACLARREGAPLPRHLFLSGRAAPVEPPRSRPLHALPRAEFLTAVGKDFGGIPDEAWKSEELLDLIEPILRADFQAVEEYRPAPGLPRLEGVPADLLLGEAEPAPPPDAPPWESVLAASLPRRLFPGGHFFLFAHGPEVARLVVRRLAEDST